MKKILIVEDEATSRKILSVALEGPDRKLIFADNGDQAVKLAQEHRPDLIIMDIMLPHLNGFDATGIIKSTPDLIDVPVVALTARTMKYDRDQALKSGCTDFIAKPFRVGDLRRRLSRFLD